MGIQALQEYRKLVELYRVLPRDMFVTQIMGDYYSSETYLERIRVEYFEHLKQVQPEFPFGTDAELKRLKLAQDIHTIIGELEGGDYSTLKPLISTGKSHKQSLVANNRVKVSAHTFSDKHKCSCSAELTCLKEIFNNLQVDILLLKQSSHANERIHTEQINSTKSNFESIREDVISCKSNVTRYVCDTECAMRNLTPALVQRITELENRIWLLENFLETEQIVTIARVESDACDDTQSVYIMTQRPHYKVSS